LLPAILQVPVAASKAPEKGRRACPFDPRMMGRALGRVEGCAKIAMTLLRGSTATVVLLLQAG
jgi:hypothetical protein